MREVRRQVIAAGPQTAHGRITRRPNQVIVPGGGEKAAVRGNRGREENAVDGVEQVMVAQFGLKPNF